MLPVIVRSLCPTTLDHEVRTAGAPLLVELWAEACGSCKAMLPVLARLAAGDSPTIRVGELRLDDAPEIAERFEVRALPTFLVFDGGELRGRVTGAMPIERLRAEVQALLEAARRGA